MVKKEQSLAKRLAQFDCLLINPLLWSNERHSFWSRANSRSRCSVRVRKFTGLIRNQVFPFSSVVENQNFPLCSIRRPPQHVVPWTPLPPSLRLDSEYRSQTSAAHWRFETRDALRLQNTNVSPGARCGQSTRNLACP
jgi:hypothetical protein